MAARARLRTVLPAFALASSLALPSAVADEYPQITLDWHAPAECPDQAALRARVEQLRGPESQGANTSPLDVRGFVTLLLDGRFRAELELVQGGSERSRVLEAPTCTGLAEASAAVIALAISPAARGADEHGAPPQQNALVASSPSVGPSPSPAATPASAPAPAPAPARPTAEHRALPFGVDASAGIAGDFGATAAAALGASVLGRLRYGNVLSFALRGSFFPERASTLASAPNEGVKLLLVAAAPLACLTPFDLPVELAACAEFELGYLHARGFGTQAARTRASSWLAPGGGLSAAFPRRARLRSRLSADALFPLTTTQFRLTNAGTAHELPTVAPRVSFYLELAFQ